MLKHRIPYTGAYALSSYAITYVALSEKLSLAFPAETLLRGGEGTVDWDTVASNCSTGNRLSNFSKRINSTTRIEQFELDEDFHPYHPPFWSLARLCLAAGTGTRVAPVMWMDAVLHLSLYVCMYIYIYTYIYVYTDMHMHMYMNIYMYM